MSGIRRSGGMMVILLGLLQVGSSTPTATPSSTPFATSTAIAAPSPVIIDIHRDKHMPALPHLSDWVDITFQSQAGLGYDIYQGPRIATPTWSWQGSRIATASLTTYRDPGPVFEERYYRIAVQGTSPAVYSVNEAGVLPLTVFAKTGLQPAHAAMLGVSLKSTEAGGTLQEVIGWQSPGAPDPDFSTELWALDPWSSGYKFGWLFDSGGTVPTLDGTWIDPNLGDTSTLAMPLGFGFWVYNKTASDQTVYLDGLVAREETPMTVLVDDARIMAHQMGQPFAEDVPLDEGHTSFLADGARETIDPDLSDEIWVWNQASYSYSFAWLFDSNGTTPSMDGVWIDPNTGSPTTLLLRRGMGWWYYSKPDPTRTPSWIWTEPVPY